MSKVSCAFYVKSVSCTTHRLVTFEVQFLLGCCRLLYIEQLIRFLNRAYVIVSDNGCMLTFYNSLHDILEWSNFNKQAFPETFTPKTVIVCNPVACSLHWVIFPHLWRKTHWIVGLWAQVVLGGRWKDWGGKVSCLPCLSQGNKSTIVRVSGALWQPCKALSEANSNNALKDRRVRERQEGKKQQGPF